MSRARLAFLAGVLGLSTLTPVQAQDGTDYIASAPLVELGLVKSWQLRLPLEEGQAVTDVYLVDDALYAITNDGYAFAVHAPTGALRWLRRVTTGGYHVMRPAHIRDRVCFVTAAAVLQLDRVYGRAEREFSLRFPAGSPPASDGFQVYIGGLDHRLYAFAPDYNFENWKAGLYAPITSGPQIRLDVLPDQRTRQRLFVASEDGRVIGMVAYNRQLLQMGQTFGSITADLVVRDEGVYVACQDQSLYLLDLEYLEERWRARLNAPLFEPPVVIGDSAYQFNSADGVAAVSTGVVDVNDRVRWTLPRARMVLCADGDRVLVLSRDGALLGVAAQDGAVRHDIPAPGLTIPIPTPDQTAVMLASPDGRLFCARKIGVPFVRAEDVRAALGRGTAPGDASAAQAPQAEPLRPTPAVDLSTLLTPRAGVPLGGKSKISRNWTGQAPSNPTPADAPAGAGGDPDGGGR